jgi:uncharacterized protein (DUF924 family)
MKASTSSDVLNFWFRELDSSDWFKKDPRIDLMMKERFLELLKSASKGELTSWRETAEGRLAEILLLDQFSRNIYRDSKKAFENDALALELAKEMVSLGLDKNFSSEKKAFIYLPFMHSENLDDHKRAEELFSQEGLEENLDYEKRHHRILERFGRYPHRNKILGRKSTALELEFLKQPGSQF